MLQNRLQILRDIDEYKGEYFSKNWIRKKVLFMNEDEIEDIDKQIDDEKQNEPDDEGDSDQF
jgi:hypothetical protein